MIRKREKAKEIPEEEDGYYFDLDHDEWDSATAHSILPEHEQFTVDSRVHGKHRCIFTPLLVLILIYCIAGNWTRFIKSVKLCRVPSSTVVDRWFLAIPVLLILRYTLLYGMSLHQCVFFVLSINHYL